MPQHGVEVVDRDLTAALSTDGCRGRLECVVGDRDGVALDIPSPVVEAVDAHDVEPGSEGVDLAQKVAARRSGPRRARSGGVLEVAAMRVPLSAKLAEHPGHHHRVARVVELELVDRDEGRAGEQLHGLLVAEGADEGGVLDERSVVLAPRGELPERGEQVGLADAEAAVEVEARFEVGSLLAEQAPAALPGGRERPHLVDGLSLRRVVGVGPVVLECRIVELPRRNEGCRDLVARHRGRPVEQRQCRHGACESFRFGNVRVELLRHVSGPASDCIP